MARPRSIHNDQILEAARAVFLERGPRAPASAIARAAGVSEGTIFKRFPTKERLFFAAMGLPDSPLQRPGGLMGGREGDVRAQLVEVSLEIVGFLRVMLPRMMMLCAHPAYDPVKLFDGELEPQPLRVARALGAWLEEQARAGRVELGDGEMTARVLLGALHSFVFFEVTGMHGPRPPEAREYVVQLVGLFWRGIAPRA